MFKRKTISLKPEIITDHMPNAKPQVVTMEDISNNMMSLIDESLSEIDKLQSEIDKIEKPNQTLLKKAERLTNLGFSNSSTVKSGEELKDKTQEKRWKLDGIVEEQTLRKQYKKKYPHHKFVPQRIIDEILEKYDLYHAEVSRYVKDIPEKNLEEIERFVESGHQEYRIQESYENWSRTKGRILRVHTICKGSYEDCKQYLEHWKKREEERGNPAWINLDHIHKVPFDIAAPIDHFNLNDSEIKDRRIGNKPIVVEDPIVFYPVEGGGLVVTAWGEEAKDLEIVNPDNN